MVSDLDIYRSANLLIREHGEDAKLEASLKADKFLEKGDMDGVVVWKKIISAIEVLQNENNGETIH